MGRMNASAIGALAALAAISCPVTAQAAIAVFGGGYGEACWRAALASTFDRHDSAAAEAHWKADSIKACDDALDSDMMNPQDTWSTWVNRGILEMSRENYPVAEKNFRQAIAMNARLAEAHVNLGSTMINMQRYEEGVSETQIGIDLNSKEIERAYYNLGLAYEFLGKLQLAYNSYKQASLLAPKWQDPKDQMARFVVQDIKH